MKNNTLTIKTVFEMNQIVTFYHPKHGRVKGKVLSTEYWAGTGQTVNLHTDFGLVRINERFLERLVLAAA